MLGRGASKFCLLLGIYAAAAAKSLQSFPTLCDPIDGSPPGSAVPADRFIPSWLAWSHKRASFLADAAAVVSATT